MKEYGIQLYSLRDISGDDLEGAIKAVAEMGYSSIEFAGFFGHSAEEVKGWLEKYNIKVVGTHTGWQALANDFDATVAYHKAIGCTDLIIPGAPIGTKAEVDDLVNKINDWFPRLEKEGIRLHYHNHAREFQKNADGIIPEYELLNRTKVYLETDTYWIYVAGVDPCKILDDFGERIKFIHLKDGTKEGKGLSLGLGTAPVAKVREKAEATGRYVIVESEGCEPTGKEEVKRCIDYLLK